MAGVTWRATILTLYPEMFPGPLGVSLAGRAMAEGKWACETVQIRDFAIDKHRTVDDAPYGGGSGMVMTAPSVVGAIESLPVAVHQWGHLKMGSAVKRGEGDAIVTATGQYTFLGTAARLMASVQSQGHLQAVLLRITMVLLVLSVTLCAIIFAKLMTTRNVQSARPSPSASA